MKNIYEWNLKFVRFPSSSCFKPHSNENQLFLFKVFWVYFGRCCPTFARGAEVCAASAAVRATEESVWQRPWWSGCAPAGLAPTHRSQAPLNLGRSARRSSCDCSRSAAAIIKKNFQKLRIRSSPAATNASPGKYLGFLGRSVTRASSR